MPRAFIGVGSNIHPERNVRAALHLLALHVDVLSVSTFYRTRPLGGPRQSKYINGVVAVETDLSPADLKFGVLRAIERRLGRIRQIDKNAARVIDLDLLLYDDIVVATDGLVLPDPDIFERAFLAKPLAELDPLLILPGSGESIGSVAARMSGADMEELPEFTQQLREELAGVEYASHHQAR